MPCPSPKTRYQCTVTDLREFLAFDPLSDQGFELPGSVVTCIMQGTPKRNLLNLSSCPTFYLSESAVSSYAKYSFAVDVARTSSCWLSDGSNRCIRLRWVWGVHPRGVCQRLMQPHSFFSRLYATDFDLPWALHASPYAFPFPKLLRESKALDV